MDQTQPQAPDKSTALHQILEIMSLHNVTISDITAALNKSADLTLGDKTSGSLLQKVIIYIGAAFIFMGICVFIGMMWDDLNSPARIILTLGSGFIAYILGLMTLKDKKYNQATTPLLLVGAAVQPTGLFVFMDEYLPKSGDVALAALSVFCLMTAQQFITFLATQRTCLLFFTLFFLYATMYSTINWLEIDQDLGFLSMGLSLLTVCYGLRKSPNHSILPFFYFCGATMTAVAAFDMLEDTSMDTAMIAVSAGLIYLSTLAASRTLLTVGVLSLLAFLAYFTDKYFSDTIGWPLAMILFGLMMIGISVFAVKLGKKIVTN